jgi:hypothetical protein
MKKLLLIVLVTLTSCSTVEYRDLPIEVSFEFSNRVNQGLFQHNLRDCRVQPQCSVDQLFDRW